MNSYVSTTLILTACALAGCSSSDPAPAPQPSESPSGRPAQAGEPAAARRFHVRYETKLEKLTPGQRLRLWIPLPKDDPHQTISGVKVTAPWEHRTTRESVWGNRMVYLEGTPTEATLSVRLDYDVARREIRTDLKAADAAPAAPLADAQRYLEGTQLLRVTPKIRAEHARITPKGGTVLASARAYYDYVRETMTYDKSGEGWGRGDSAYACEVGRGNCTDYHALFQALCMVEGIPSRFSIGLYGSYERAPGEPKQTGGYHCWASFYAPKLGWVPVDISEADKDPSKGEAFFGGHSDNRVTLSTGRDLLLEPKQAGAPLNYFVNPYAEVEGKVFLHVSKSATWTDAAK